MYLQKLRSYSFVTALLISGCVTASASVVVYTDFTTWQSATSNVNTIAFEGITTPDNKIVQYNGGANGDTLTIGSVSFQGFDTASGGPDLEVNDSLSPNWGTGAILRGPGPFTSSSRIVASLGPGVFAVGSNVFALDGEASDAATVTMVLSTGSTVYSVNTVAGFGSYSFIGFTSDTAITSISFFPPSPDRVIIDNFSTGGQAAVSQTPEAATMILCGGGLLLIGLVRRHRNSNSEP